jgi:secondary thiamine-phosphate synthase enzyme
MTVYTHTLTLQTHGYADIHDITDLVADSVNSSRLQNGTVTVFCPSSTSGVTTIEFETGVLNDLRRLFDEIIPPDGEYTHNARWGDGNGHAHVRAALLGASLSIPFVKGRLMRGIWQQIIYVDFDNRPRSRELIVQIIGE